MAALLVRRLLLQARGNTIVRSPRMFIYTQLLFLDKPRMRILVLSDLHANATAFSAALDAAKMDWDHVVCLGDIVGYGPDPNEVTQTSSRTWGANHSRQPRQSRDRFNANAAISIRWQRRRSIGLRSQLSPENLKWLTDLPQGPVEAEGLVLVHGAFQDEDEYVFMPAQALEGLLDSTAAITFFGHTHHQGGFSYANSSSQLEVLSIRPRNNESFAPLRIEPELRYLLNPGSVGQPRDGDPRAAFAIADMEHGVVEFWRVPYDISEVQARMRTAGLPEPLVHRFVVGALRRFWVFAARESDHRAESHATRTPNTAAGPRSRRSRTFQFRANHCGSGRSSLFWWAYIFGRGGSHQHEEPQANTRPSLVRATSLRAADSPGRNRR